MLRHIAKSIFIFMLLNFALVKLSTAQSHEDAIEDTSEEVVADTTATVAAPKWALSLNAGVTLPYTDVPDKSVSPVIGIGASYYITTFLHANIDVQKGWLKSGADVNDNGTGNMGSKNSYFSASLTARFLPFGLLKNAQKKSVGLNILSGFYGGVGIGFITNSINSNAIISNDYGSIGKYSGTSLMLPIETGINIPVLLMTHNRRLLLNANVRANLCFSDKIDGYIPTVNANKKNDAFDTFTLGLVYNF